MRRGALAAGMAAVAALAGCGTPGADLLVIHRTGTIPGAELRLRVIDDGHVVCNGGPQRELPSDLLIQAREVERDLQPLATRAVALPPRPGAVMRYAVTLEQGTVTFSDVSAHQPPPFYRVALLIRRIAKGPCGLPR